MYNLYTRTDLYQFNPSDIADLKSHNQTYHASLIWNLSLTLDYLSSTEPHHSGRAQWETKGSAVVVSCEYGTLAIEVCLFFNFAVAFSSTYFLFQQKYQGISMSLGAAQWTVHLSLKVLANEKRGVLAVVSFDRSRFKLFSRKFSKNVCWPHPVRGLKLLREPCFCHLKAIITTQ